MLYYIVYNTIHLYANQPQNLTTPPDFTQVKSSWVEDMPSALEIFLSYSGTAKDTSELFLSIIKLGMGNAGKNTLNYEVVLNISDIVKAISGAKNRPQVQVAYLSAN